MVFIIIKKEEYNTLQL